MSMSLNWKEIDMVLAELSLPGSLVQKIRQPNYHSLLIDLYDPEGIRYPLLIELEAKACRLHRLQQGIPANKTGKLQRFAQLMRSRIQGGCIREATQIGCERIVLITIDHQGELTHLYVRLWSNAANIIATDEHHTILDAFYRRPKRGEVSGNSYDPKPSQRSPSPVFSVPRQSFLTAVNSDPTLTFNEFIEREYATETKEQLAQETVSQTRELLKAEKQRLARALEKKESELTSLSSYEQIRHTGDLLASGQHFISPGSTWVSVPDYEQDNRLVSIEVDPAKSAGENIEAYYERYQKAKRAHDHLQEEIQQARRHLQELDENLRALSSPDEDPEQLSALAKKLQQRYAPRGGGAEQKQEAPGLQFRSGIFTILVGRTAAENDMLLRRYTRGNDYWLHTRDYPGGYVFIKYIPGKTVPLETLLDAGNLAVYYSKARNNGKADLYYTQVKHLRRAKHARQGTVLPTQEKNITIEIDQRRLDALFTGGTNHE
ncbi:MAG: NFACT RNA binding domain-containing protein [Spirochaetota bacterium]